MPLIYPRNNTLRGPRGARPDILANKCYSALLIHIPQSPAAAVLLTLDCAVHVICPLLLPVFSQLASSALCL